MMRVVNVVADLGANADLVETLVQADIIHVEISSEGDPLISEDDAETLRVVHVLTTELDVNLAGVEVILHMREDMLALQRQVREILDAVAQEVRFRARR